VHIDDGFVDAGIGQLVEHVIEQRTARHLHQRLRHPVRQGAHAQAEAGGEDHGFAGFDRHVRKFLGPWVGFSNHITAFGAAYRVSPMP
jgi:hypothetical protein